MASKDFDQWYGGAPVLPTGATGDFAAWYQGAPVLQLQLSATVEIVGSGGVEVGGAAVIEVVVGGPPSQPGLGGGISIARRRPTPKKRRQVVVVGAGGVEVYGAAELAVAVQQEGAGGVEVDGEAELALAVAWEARGGVMVGGAAEIARLDPSQRWWDRRVQEDEDLILMEVL
jgi:hypothetical protein